MRKIFLLFSVLAFTLASCNREESHVVIPTAPEQQQGGALVGFNTDKVTNKKFNDTHIYGFDAAQRMVIHKYHATQQELSNDLFAIKGGTYTFVAVLNVGPSFQPAMSDNGTLKQSRADVPLHEISLSQLLVHVKQSEDNFPDMLTGMHNRTITTDDIIRVEIPLSDKSSGISMTTVTANITLPDAEFETYQKSRTRATAPHNLRGVLAFYRKGTDECVLRHVQVLKYVSLGNYALTAEVSSGDYDLLLWVDYTESDSKSDLWYNTQNLRAVTLLSTDKTYTSGSDTRETFYGTSSVTTAGTAIGVNMTVIRPHAKYVLISNDLKRYRELMTANPDKYVPLEELRVNLIYESYLPDGFNVRDGKPNSSQQGYKSNKISLPSVGATATDVRIGSDYVFVNGGESSVTVTIVVTDKTGRTVSRVQGVVIEYKRNMLTTITGDFLTAGVINPGVNINTDWDGVFEVEF